MFHYPNKKVIKCAKTLYPDDLAEKLADEMFKTCRVSPSVTCRKLSIEELRDMIYVYEEQCLCVF